jgi:energy-coupling factor transporter ATP-binding protein EcfA2
LGDVRHAAETGCCRVRLIGDKLIIEKHHTDRAAEICGLLVDRIQDEFVITVGGESGSGKSELASEIARLLTERGLKAGILQQDDYFVFLPKTNHEMRRRNLEQVGPYEVKLDFLDSNLRSSSGARIPSTNPWSSTKRTGSPARRWTPVT